MTNILTNLEMVDKSDEAFASVNLNPALAWAKFILTDDLPNANNQRVPLEEFENLINTGVYMPIKMAEGQILDGHDGAIPIGTIANLKKVNNQIQGLAALWERERPEDVQLIKKYYNEKVPLQLSWEILYSDSSISESNVEELKGTALRAVTLVGMPAYEGRTPITAVASSSDTPQLDDASKAKESHNNNMEDDKLEKEEFDAKLAEKDTALAAANEEIKNLKAMLEELDALRQFKAEIDQEKANAEKISAIRQKFSGANLAKEDTYFDENKEMLLSLSEQALDFMIQELVAFSSKDANSSKKTKTEIPPIVSDDDESEPDFWELAEFLRNKKK
jgi:hypothetical protein